MFGKLLAILARSLDKAGIPYMVIGGQAVLIHGEPRFTRDIDVAVAADPNAIQPLTSMVLGLGWKILSENPENFAAETLVLPCEDPESGIRFDFIFGLTPYKVRFATAEDLVIHKILAGRPRDLEDITGILLKNPGINSQFIRDVLTAFSKELDQPLIESFEQVLKRTQ